VIELNSLENLVDSTPRSLVQEWHSQARHSYSHCQSPLIGLLLETSSVKILQRPSPYFGTQFSAAFLSLLINSLSRLLPAEVLHPFGVDVHPSLASVRIAYQTCVLGGFGNDPPFFGPLMHVLKYPGWWRWMSWFLLNFFSENGGLQFTQSNDSPI